MYKSYLVRARELQEFFTNTYVERVLEDAIKSENEELLRITVNQYESDRWQIEQAEDEVKLGEMISRANQLDGDWEHDEARDNVLSHEGAHEGEAQ